MFKKLRTLLTVFTQNAHLLIVAFVSFSLRFINLGYSDYQGDEIKSFFILEQGQSVSDFLLNQRKGPGQFFITLLVKLVNPGYDNEFVTRFLFALAGSLAVVYFFKFIKHNFDTKIAFYASMFFATNGFFVALSRISQYQSFVILFMIMALYFISRAVENEKYARSGLFFAFIFWSFAILFHYDGVFIAPIMAYYLYHWHKKYNNVKFLMSAAAFSGILLAFFYIPFIINISQNTLAYWGGRITGEVSAKLSSSKYLFTVYQPIYVIHFYTMLFLSGCTYICLHFFKKIFPKNKIFNKLPDLSFKMPIILAISAWFIFSAAFFEGLVYIPGTHIYNYLLPMFVILALGIEFIEKILDKFSKLFIPWVISYTGILVLFLFLYLQSYAIFVDHSKEYPWETEKFLIWEFPKPTPIFHLSMFGFPYFRDWEEIRNVVMASDNNGYYSTNERESIARYYVPLKKSTDAAGYYIYILNPQSFTNTIQQEKAQYWADRYAPVFSFSKGGKDMVRVYSMEPGKLEQIIEKGY